MDPITEAEAQLVHVHARSLAAAQVVALGAFNEEQAAEDAVRLFRATKAAVGAFNARAAEITARIESRISESRVSQTTTPPAGVQAAP